MDAAWRRSRTSPSAAGEPYGSGPIGPSAIGDELDQELLTAADRFGQRVHSFTERAARPLDHTSEQVLDGIGRLTHALNPIRFTGRLVEVGVTAALRTAGAVTSKAGRTARRGADALTP